MEIMQHILHLELFCENKISFTPLSANANILTVTIYSLCWKEHSRAGQVSSACIASGSWMLHHQSHQLCAPQKNPPAATGSPRCPDQPVALTRIALTAAMRTQPPAVSESRCFRGRLCWRVSWNLNGSIQQFTKKYVFNLCGFFSPEYLMKYRLEKMFIVFSSFHCFLFLCLPSALYFIYS